MLWSHETTSAARPQPSKPDAWIIAPDVHLGLTGRVREVWRYRRIFLFFATRAVRGLTANTKLGIWWLLIRPLMPVFVGTAIFGEVMGAPSDGLPYFLFFLTGSTIWSFFLQPLRRGSFGLEANRLLITKLYIPRVILPAGQLSAGLVTPLILTAVFAVTLCYYRVTAGIWYGVEPGRVPVAVASALAAIALAFAVSLWTSVWQARARDTRYVLTYVMSFWFFLTPVMYPLSMIPEHVRWIALINPMTGPVEAFRWSLLGVGAPSWSMLAVSGGVIGAVLAGGLWYFTATESVVTDAL
jgi:lipopolysaccharide transport system permease protein